MPRAEPLTDEPFHDGLAIRHDKWGNEVLLWMGNDKGEETIAVRDLVRRDVPTQARIQDMRRRVHKLEELRSFIEVTRDALLTPEQRARIAKEDTAQSTCASALRAAAAANANNVQQLPKALCFVCGARVVVHGTAVADHVDNCIREAEAIVKRHNLEQPALPSVPSAKPPVAAPPAEDSEQQDQQRQAKSDEIDMYNRHARRCFVACMRDAPDQTKVTVTELGRLLAAQGR